jgi:hypothetical protein
MNEDVVDIDMYSPCGQLILQYGIHELLERSWCICEAESHNCILVLAKQTDEGCIWFVSFSNPDVVELSATGHQPQAGPMS